MANFVATMTFWRFVSFRAFPNSSSFVKGPSISAVSQKLAPPASARASVFNDSASFDGPYAQDIPMHPRPMADTSRPCRPSFRLITSNPQSLLEHVFEGELHN